MSLLNLDALPITPYAAPGTQPDKTASGSPAPDTALDKYGTDIHRQNLITLGRDFSPADIKSYRSRARYGDPRFLYAMYDELMRLGPRPQMTKAIEAMKSAHVQFVTHPEDFDDEANTPEDADPTAVKVARTARKFLEDTLSEHLTDLIEQTAGEFFYGIADSRVILQPRGNVGRYDAIDEIVSIPQRRHRLDPVTHEWMLMLSPDSWVGEPISTLLLQPDKGTEGLFFTEIGAGSSHLDQRGLLFECLVPWGIVQYAWRWRARWVELYGIPPMFGFADSAVPGQREQMLDMLNNFGSSMRAVFDKVKDGVTDIKLLEAASGGAQDPFDALISACMRLMDAAILGHEQGMGVQRGVGGKIQGDTALQQFEDITNSRLRTISGQIRRQLGRTLVWRNFGQDVAIKHTPSIKLRFVERDDPNVLAAVALQLYGMGLGPLIAGEDLVRRCTLRVAEGDEKAGAPLVQPAVPPSFTAHALAALPKPRDPDPDVPKGLGEEIVGDIRDLIRRAAEDGATPAQLVGRIRERAGREPNAPRLVDNLSALMVNAMARGSRDVRAERKRT